MKKGMEEKIDDLTAAVSSLQKAVVRFEDVQDALVVRVGAVEEYMQEELATKKELASFRGEALEHLDRHTHMLVRLDEERLVAHAQIMHIRDDVAVLKHK